jgi:iron(III) transport system ATP-binding protein
MSETTAAAATNAVTIRNLSKTYPNVSTPAVSNLSLDVPEGSIMTLLGPSGCGKTTTLRMVAGLEKADTGTIQFGTKTVVDGTKGTSVAPNRRDLGMVFQSYAIWPHMTVAQNVAMPLKAHHVPRKQIPERVQAALDLVGMGKYGNRPAPLLSGGQQQRVALARALVLEPKVLLLDEPFSNLDSALRGQMRMEVKMLQRRLNIAALFVTHDQIEALTLSDNIVVMKEGQVQQIGDPRRLYNRPANDFVRDFIGQVLFFPGEVDELLPRGENRIMVKVGGSVIAEARETTGAPSAPGQRIRLAVRPEDILVVARDAPVDEAGHLPATVMAALFTGETMEYRVEVPGMGEYTVRGDRHENFTAGDRVSLRLRRRGHTIWPLDEPDTAA